MTVFVCFLLWIRPVKAKKRRGGFNKISQLSPQLEKVLGTSQLARTEVLLFFVTFLGDVMFWVSKM